MGSRLQLTLPASFGNTTVGVDAKRFSIGRTPENDLAIDDPSLSRRHALIEDVDGAFTITDCGSSNGTLINGRQVSAPTALSDWDVLTLGAVTDVVVRLQEAADQFHEEQSDDSSTKRTSVAARPNPIGAPGPITPPVDPILSKPFIAIAAAVVILLITGVALMMSQRSRSGSSSNSVTSRQQRAPAANYESTGTPVSPGSSDTIAENNSNDESSELSIIESYASKVLTGISRDTRPVLTEKPLEQINANVQRYKGSSSLQAQLQSMKRSMSQVSSMPKCNRVRTPLVVYATLAIIDRDGRGEPAQVAAGLCPTLARMRAIFGDELAADSLLSVAALEEGPSLQMKINRLAGQVKDSPATIRSVWYLHDHRVISDQSYSLVLRFLAIGVIAQDPQKFGVAAEPLIF